MAFRRLLQRFKPVALPPSRSLHARESAIQKRARVQMEETIEQFKKEDFSGIRAQLPLGLRAILPELVLRKGWKIIQLFAGPIVSTGTPTVSEGWFTNTASMSIQFRRMKMTMAMQMTKSGTVVGLRFLPSSLAALGLRGSKSLWQRPTYDSPELYEEVQINLGRRYNAVGGTLTLPRAAHKSPCVILLSGSGPCDQDSTLQAAKPFKDIACGLATHGIAVLRFDKVTFVHGKMIAKKTDFTLTDEYCEHAAAAIEKALQHPQISSSEIFLAGHSLGATVTPKLSKSITSIKGFILLAPPAGAMYWSAVRQLEYLSHLESGRAEKLEDKGLEELRQAAMLADSPDLSESTPADQLPFGIGAHYWLDSRNFRPVVTTRETNKPVLILQGERDYQVTMLDDYSLWEASLRGMDNVQMRSYENLNHLFMSCHNPSTSSDYEKPCNVEYSVIEDIASWVQSNKGCAGDP